MSGPQFVPATLLSLSTTGHKGLPRSRQWQNQKVEGACVLDLAYAKLPANQELFITHITIACHFVTGNNVNLIIRT